MWITVAGCCPYMEKVYGRQEVSWCVVSECFDKVPHVYLLKWKIAGIDGSLLSWICDYLTNRRQNCIIEGCVSGWLLVTSGVPQGIILGPLLFLLYINDIADKLTSKVALFADNCIRTKEDQYWICRMIWPNQQSGARWQLLFNPEICEVLELGRVKQSLPTLYLLTGQKFKVVEKHKHLGLVNWVGVVTLTKQLPRLERCEELFTEPLEEPVYWLSSSFTNLLWFQCLNMHSPTWGSHTKKNTQKLELASAKNMWQRQSWDTMLWTMRLNCV